MTIQSQIDRLSKSDMAALIFALKQAESYIVKFDDNSYVGVNLGGEPHIDRLGEEGAWSYGNIKRQDTHTD